MAYSLVTMTLYINKMFHKLRQVLYQPDSIFIILNTQYDVTHIFINAVGLFY